MRSRFLAVALVLALAACERGAPPPPAAPPLPATAPAAARALALEAGPGLLRIDSHREQGTRHVAFSGWFRGEALVYLVETVTQDGVPPAVRRWYFEHGQPFYFTGEAPTAHAEWQGVRALEAVRTEHYGEVPLAAADAEALRRDGLELGAALAREAAAATTTRRALSDPGSAR